MGRIKKFFSLRNFLVLILVVLVATQYFSVRNVGKSLKNLEKGNSSMITEIGQLRETYTTFGDDINEIREYLYLPTKNYSALTMDLEAEPGEDSGEENTDEVQLAMFKYVDYLGSSSEKEALISEKRQLIDGLINSEEFINFISESGLTLGAVEENQGAITLSIDIPEVGNLVYFYLSKEDGSLIQKTVEEKVDVEADNAEDFVSGVTAFVEENQSTLTSQLNAINDKKNQIISAINSEEVVAAATEKGVTISTEPIDENLQFIFVITNNENGEQLAEIHMDQKSLEISLVDLRDDSNIVVVTDISSGLAPFVNDLNTKSLLEQKADMAKADLERTISDSGFQAVLDQNNLTIAEEAREDEDRFYYDIKMADGTHISSIVIEKATGVISITEPDGTNSQNLLYFEPESKKKTLELPDQIPDYGDELSSEDGTFNILIAGKHGNLVDTMIFAHVDERKREVRMISIPRDLFYNGRKINSFAFFYGMPELKRVLSEISGYQLDKYVLIDMYAFIDVIDLIGGIDVTLEHAVIDPTYRTVDNGVVGTLHYEPGDYHLGGKEALRLARSRYTSSDFARAARQQLIIEAIQTKARNFGFGDADTFYEIAKSVLAKTETDVSLDEAVAYFFRYQNFDIVSNDVMSSGNVLYVPPYTTAKQCEAQIAAGGDAGCRNANQAYTLSPRDNNWNVIKWYFREKFEGEGAA